MVTLFGLNVALFEGHTQVTDDFLDGNDQGWVHFDPLAPSGAGATYSFPPNQTPLGLDHRYHIEAGPSPNPELYGSARAGSFRLDISPNAAGASWSLHGWSSTANQTFGGFVGVSFGLNGTFDGYGFAYSTAGSLDILRIEKGVSSVLATAAVSLDPSSIYLFTFSTSWAGGLTGRLYETPDFITPVATVETIVPDFVNGASGLYLFSNELNGGIGATFDNFQVGVIPEPSPVSILGLGGFAGLWFARRRLNSR